jgi:hypothetical protein
MRPSTRIGFQDGKGQLWTSCIYTLDHAPNSAWRYEIADGGGHSPSG